MQKSITREEAYENLKGNREALRTALMQRQMDILERGNLPAETSRELYNKARQYGLAIVWLDNIEKLQFPDLMPKNGEGMPHIIHPDN